MAEAKVDPIWLARLPHEWPPAPVWMSVSSLQNIETCPRRWSLSFASYPDIWSYRGFPPRVYLATLQGHVLHSALELIVKSLTRAGCSSVASEDFVNVMRALGGYTIIVERTIANVLTKLNANPRFTARSRHVVVELKKTAPTLRENLQILTRKLRLESAYCGVGVEQKERPVLHDGSYAEIELRVATMHWHGFVDILTLSKSKCEIVDFKTGEPSPEHEEQIRIYSLLWARDSDLNPRGRIADTLTLSYSKGEVAVKPLSSSELITFEKALMLRTNDALAAVQQIPPRAVPSISNCTFCSVRHLCDDYWTEATQRQLAEGQSEQLPSELRKLTDLEVDIEKQESPFVWRGTVLSSRFPSSNSSILIRIPQETHSLGELIKRGRRLRITDALVIDQAEGEARFPVIGLSRFSEVFVV